MKLTVNPHVTDSTKAESQGLKWGTHPAPTVSVVSYILVEPPVSSQQSQRSTGQRVEWQLPERDGDSWKVPPLSCCTHVSAEDTLLEVTEGSFNFLLEVLVFSLSSWFTSGSEQERQKAGSGEGKGERKWEHEGQISMWSVFTVSLPCFLRQGLIPFTSTLF